MKIMSYLIILVLMTLSSCNKNETNLPDEINEQLSGAPATEQSETPMPPPLREGAHNDIPDLSGAKVIIPDMVKGKWKGVTLMLEDKISHEITEHTINLGDEWLVPDSNLKIKVGTFLPDLIIQGKIFTSVSNELKNPAIHVTIIENDKELFEGWLFSLFPTMHSFQHDRFAITLKDVIAS